MGETRIGQLLLEAGLVSEAQLREALTRQERTGWKLGSTLVSLGFIDENVLATFLSMQTGVPCVSLANVFPSQAVLDLLPKELARRASAIPIKRVDDTLHVAMTDPTDGRALQQLQDATGLRIVPLICPATAVSRALRSYYQRGRRAQSGALAPRVPEDIEAELDAMEQSLQALSQSLRRLRRRLHGERAGD